MSERPVSENRSLWYHFGPQGETRQLTNAGGNVIDSYVYTAYGVSVASSGTEVNPFRYGGQVGYYAESQASGLAPGTLRADAVWQDSAAQAHAYSGQAEERGRVCIETSRAVAAGGLGRLTRSGRGSLGGAWRGTGEAVAAPYNKAARCMARLAGCTLHDSLGRPL